MTVQLSEKLRKHARVIVYLLGSALIAWGLAYFADRPELAYFAPVVNYILFVLEKEIKEEGVVKTMLKE